MNRTHMDLLYAGKALPEQQPKRASKPRKAKAPTAPKVTEHAEQCAFHQWLRWNNIPHFAVPNQNTASFYDNRVACSIANKKAAEGVSKGALDLVIFLPKLQLFLEMKVKGGVVSPEQQEWLDVINSYPYCKGVVAYGCDEAIRITKELL